MSTREPAMTTYANFLLQNIALAVAGLNDPRDRLSEQVWMLQGAVRNLCAQRDAERDSHIAAMQEALEFIEDFEDVEDGSYGQQVANQAMQLGYTLRDAIAKAGGAA